LLGIIELFVWNRTVRHRRKQVGAQTLIGRNATVVSPCRPDGQVRVDGEIWPAWCALGAAIQDSVRILGRDRLTLIIEPVPR
jgi:membrane protein implicated in regulation of membrane protease activity